MSYKHATARDVKLRERVLHLFYVDFESGTFIRKRPCGGRPSGEIAGSLRPDGYINISLDNKSYLAHRLIVFLKTGSWPECVDHINGKKDDNRWMNIRAVDYSINGKNQGIGKANKTGAMGVRFRKSRNAYEAYWLTPQGRRRHKNFSCDVYGNDEALKMAIECRESMVSELNMLGEGYTDMHGKRPAA